MAPVHQPAMADEVVAYLEPQEGKVLLDMTVGMGGHARRLIERGAFVIGLDRDKESLEKAAQVLAGLESKHMLLWGRISEAEELLAEEGIEGVDGCLIDAGISMDVMLDEARGFSAHSRLSLDMRMDRSQPGSLTAFRIVNEYLEKELADIFAVTGRGREARNIAARIVRTRQRAPIQTTAQLAELIAATIARGSFTRAIDAAPYLMAIRYAVNDELDELRAGVESAVRLLSPTGKLVILSWNSAEHRVSKQALRRLANPCVCPPALPCVCMKRPVVRLLTPKPLFASPAEVAANPAARTVRLHAAEKLPAEDE